MAVTPKGLQDPLNEPLHKPAQPDYLHMTDDEILQLVIAQEGGDKFAIPPGFEPAGMVYQWKRYEVLGQPDHAGLAELESRGWSFVPQERHDGRWMARGTKGPTINSGLVLMEIHERLLAAKERLRAKQAREPTDSMMDRLSYTKPGSAPRDVDARIMPKLKRGEYAAIPKGEIEIQA